MSTPPPLRGLYAITDGPRADLLDACAAALAGGATLLQYRDKTDDVARRLDEARALAALCARAGVPLVINDDVELAARVGAGVHVGRDDADVAEARARLGARAIVGASCYASLEAARRHAAAGASYLAFGSFFASTTKPNATRATPDLLHAARPLGLPLVAIGGIRVDNARSLIDAGADMLAVVSGVFAAPDVRAAAHAYANMFPYPIE